MGCGLVRWCDVFLPCVRLGVYGGLLYTGGGRVIAQHKEVLHVGSKDAEGDPRGVR